ncbi:hypothetical protein B0H16DRAFT_1491985 [Mycena metata]|uniref:NADPH-dependent 1-acyldihydroxyacetone phosphate reductase n=1 Tax=Mycena metata TaxID=1033252 RepID=A0AAD7KEY3_9AGAR|nr:hypothetical protein B0H16DRAFT_1491985 [Mycena metata]
MVANQKTILVTGCSAGGIGAAIAYALAKRGHSVFATARDTSKLPPELATHTNVTALQVDVTSVESVAEAAKAVTAAGKGLHALVNNAGVGYTMPLLDVDVDRAMNLYDTNVWGTLRTVQAFSDLLVASRGRVVNISSVGAVVNTPWIGIYNSSKAAVTSLSDNLRIELAPLGVSVVTVMVGRIVTPFFAHDSFELPPTSRYMAIKDIITRWALGEAHPKGGTPDKLAESLVYEIVGEGRSGQVWLGPYSGTMRFLSRWVPVSLLDKIMATAQGLSELSKSLGK